MHLLFTSHGTHREQHPLPCLRLHCFFYLKFPTLSSPPTEILPILSWFSSNTTSRMEPNSPVGFHIGIFFACRTFPFSLQFSHWYLHALNTCVSGALPCSRCCRRLWRHRCDQPGTGTYSWSFHSGWRGEVKGQWQESEMP